ncbi:MAG: hypothetical protein N2445_05900 [Acidobacteria bacterium]|nr:hypothetical protein [Acidobacteriota bacterium]
MKKYPPNIDCNKALEKMKAFLQRHLKKSRKERFIVGLSGGIDSAVATSVVAESLGKERIVVAKMPYKTSSPQSEKDANLIIEKYNLKSYRIDISQIVDSYFEKTNYFLMKHLAILTI